MDVSENSGTPNSSIIINYKPSILRYPYFWKHPYKSMGYWGYVWPRNKRSDMGPPTIVTGDGVHFLETFQFWITWFCFEEIIGLARWGEMTDLWKLYEDMIMLEDDCLSCVDCRYCSFM